LKLNFSYQFNKTEQKKQGMQVVNEII